MLDLVVDGIINLIYTLLRDFFGRVGKTYLLARGHIHTQVVNLVRSQVFNDVDNRFQGITPAELQDTELIYQVEAPFDLVDY